ncbi:MAG: energy transducer TonB [Neisseriales bacterium]|nr:MAG: energy transducer TonB [Neisseriales bacterium]
MNSFKPYFAITLSLLINFAIFHQLGQKQNSWELDQSELQSGADTDGVIENINIVSQTTKVDTTKPAQKTPEEKISKKIVTETKKPVVKPLAKPVATENSPTKVADSSQNTKPITAENTPAASGRASPQIAHKAQLVSAPPPLVYPAEAIKQNAIGKVSIKAQIDMYGKISNIEVIASSGYKVLDEAAIKWFRELSFKPASDGTNPVNSTVSQTITFDLNENDMG